MNSEKIVLVSNPDQICYLTGYQAGGVERETFALVKVTSNGEISELLHLVPAMFLPQVGLMKPAQSIKSSRMELLNVEKPLSWQIQQFLGSNKGIENIYFDSEDLRVAELKNLKQKVQKLGAEIHWKELKDKEPAWDRSQKNKMEIERIRIATQKSWQSFLEWRKELLVGQSEKEAADNLTEIIFAKGIELAFPPIVAFGAGAAEPHHHPGQRQLQDDEIILVDWGGRYQNYCADLTRTFWYAVDSGVKSASPAQKIFEQRLAVVEKCLLELSKTAQIGMKITDLVELERELLGELAKYRLHSLGHGLGIAVHESPHLSSQAGPRDRLKVNSVITLEPGIYFPGWGGIRLENTYLVSKNGLIDLTI